MNSPLKLYHFRGPLLINAIILGPIAMSLFLIFWLGLDPKHTLSGGDLVGIFLAGCIICICISICASIAVYGVLVSLAIRKQRARLDHFKHFLPILTAMFPVGGTILLMIAHAYDPFLIAILISAYLTSALGWYWLSRSIANKQQHSNS